MPMSAPRIPLSEIAFEVTDAAEGGYLAKAVCGGIYTEADTLPALRTALRDAVKCHYGEEGGPATIRLRYVREEVLPS